MDDSSNKDTSKHEATPTEKNLDDELLKSFCYYFVEKFEAYLKFYLNILEENDTAKTSNSTGSTVASSIASNVPYVGAVVSSALLEGELFFIDHVNKKNSRTLADLVFHYRSNKMEFRKTLIQSSIRIFYVYQNQFSKVTCEGGVFRAMMKLGRDVADRIFNYLVENKPTKTINENELTKGVIYGDKKHLKQKSDGRTLLNGTEEWKTTSLFKKTGIYYPDENTYYVYLNSNAKKYGFRLLFPWEDIDTISKLWRRIDLNDSIKISTRHFYYETTVNDINQFIMNQNPLEKAQLEREIYFKEFVEDSQRNKEHILEAFNSKLTQLSDDITLYLRQVFDKTEENNQIVQNIVSSQTENLYIQENIQNTLEIIHNDVVESRNQQSVVVVNTETIKQEVETIKSMQNSYVNRDEVKQLAEEAANDRGFNLKEILKPKVEKELNRIINKHIRKK